MFTHIQTTHSIYSKFESSQKYLNKMKGYFTRMKIYFETNFSGKYMNLYWDSESLEHVPNGVLI